MGKKYELKVTFVEPKANSVINNYFSKLNNFDSSDPSTYYIILLKIYL